MAAWYAPEAVISEAAAKALFVRSVDFRALGLEGRVLDGRARPLARECLTVRRLLPRGVKGEGEALRRAGCARLKPHPSRT